MKFSNDVAGKIIDGVAANYIGQGRENVQMRFRFSWGARIKRVSITSHQKVMTDYTWFDEVLRGQVSM